MQLFLNPETATMDVGVRRSDEPAEVFETALFTFSTKIVFE